MVSILRHHGMVAVASAVLAGSIALPATAVADSGSAAKSVKPADSRSAVNSVRAPSVATITVNRTFTFGGGVPVGGWSNLSLNSNGTYNWSGHFHDSGAVGYDVSRVCIVRFSSGTAFLFEVKGKVAGTFSSGSRDHNWNKSGHLAALPSVWRASPTYRANCNARASWDVAASINTLIQAVGYVSQIIKVIA